MNLKKRVARLKLIISLTSIRSKPVVNALTRHYAEDIPEDICLEESGVSHSNFNRAARKVVEVENTIKKINRLED